MDWTIIAGASGAVLGSGLTLGGVWLTARQRERADLRAEALEQRAEWGRRLAMALAELAEGENRSRGIVGRTILTSLAASSLATDEDRALAETLLARVLRSELDLPTATAMDATGDDRHNEESGGGGNQ